MTRDRSDAKAVAFCGTRGVPAIYGGFETAVDEISRCFVECGYETVVFCRESSSGQKREQHEGRRLIYVKGSHVRTLDTFVSALQTGWWLLRHRREYAHVFWFNNANLPGILLTLLALIPVSVNTDGLEWRRAKWRGPFKAYYFLASFLVSVVSKRLISDSRAIQSYYRRVFRKDSEFIPYGIPRIPPITPKKEAAVLREYDLAARRYFLQITRLEPDNLPLDTVRAFQEARLEGDGMKLLVVGYQHKTPYADEVKAASGRDGVRVADAVYDQETLAVLRKNCFCYVHGNSVGGTNPALLEAMASCPRVLAIEGEFSREVLGATGYFFTPGNMPGRLRSVLEQPDQSEGMGARVRSRYQWDAVSASYMRLVEGKRADYSVGYDAQG